MKIGLVSPYDYGYPGGVIAHISDLSHGLVKAGHQVKIIAPMFDPNPDIEETFIRLGRSFPIPSGGSIARVSLSVWLKPHIRRLLSEEQFDILHIHEPLAPFLPLVILRLSDSVNIGTFHAFHGSSKLHWASKYLLENTAQMLDGRIAVSEPAMRYASRDFPGEYKIIPNGIDFQRFNKSQIPIPEFQDGKLNILFLGRLEKRKGLKYLLESFSDIKWEYPNTRLIVVGIGNEDKTAHRIIAERHIEDVIMVGASSYSDIPRYYHSADIYCSPATGGESFGIVLLEAMASGKPVIATNIDGYSSVMTNRKEGILVEPENPTSIKMALQEMISDSKLREDFAKNGLKTAARYDWANVTKDIIEYYEYHLERKRNGATD